MVTVSANAAVGQAKSPSTYKLCVACVAAAVAFVAGRPHSRLGRNQSQNLLWQKEMSRSLFFPPPNRINDGKSDHAMQAACRSWCGVRHQLRHAWLWRAPSNSLAARTATEVKGTRAARACRRAPSSQLETEWDTTSLQVHSTVQVATQLGRRVGWLRISWRPRRIKIVIYLTISNWSHT